MNEEQYNPGPHKDAVMRKLSRLEAAVKRGVNAQARATRLLARNIAVQAATSAKPAAVVVGTTAPASPREARLRLKAVKMCVKITGGAVHTALAVAAHSNEVDPCADVDDAVVHIRYLIDTNAPWSEIQRAVLTLRRLVEERFLDAESRGKWDLACLTDRIRRKEQHE